MTEYQIIKTNTANAYCFGIVSMKISEVDPLSLLVELEESEIVPIDENFNYSNLEVKWGEKLEAYRNKERLNNDNCGGGYA
ncbi:hypothetical protein [Wohlfahrtiimonas chitiniclastica]|uniref:hypothetical protein n=1 Tax=Wohlfahrtiimonas chitiniclastica TaxID=400946 RepID=UPI001BCE2F4E|nr:hypothetical protein [Wohlfahrtiimonas chitiniclastica]MBS7837370.1 hypothetical protein [Wohlfahrtiimonas chitiniclastica]